MTKKNHETRRRLRRHRLEVTRRRIRRERRKWETAGSRWLAKAPMEAAMQKHADAWRMLALPPRHRLP